MSKKIWLKVCQSLDLLQQAKKNIKEKTYAKTILHFLVDQWGKSKNQDESFQESIQNSPSCFSETCNASATAGCLVHSALRSLQGPFHSTRPQGFRQHTNCKPENGEGLQGVRLKKGAGTIISSFGRALFLLSLKL